MERFFLTREKKFLYCIRTHHYGSWTSKNELSLSWTLAYLRCYVIASVAFAVFENFELRERYENIYQIKNVFVLFVIVDHVSHTCCANELFTMTCQGNCYCFLLRFPL